MCISEALSSMSGCSNTWSIPLNRRKTKALTNVERMENSWQGWAVGKGKLKRELKNNSIYRHPISFPIMQTSETRDLFGLFSYGTFFGTISKEKSNCRTLCCSFPAAGTTLVLSRVRSMIPHARSTSTELISESL